MEVDKQSDIVFKKIKPKIQKRFEMAKDELLEAFDEDDVTTEIEGGADATSKFVKTKAGGNLFSLLGFFSDQDPTTDLREIIEESITLQIKDAKKVNTTNGITWETPVRLPTLDDLNEMVTDKTPLDWSPARSWVMLIEKGIPWFAYYLFDDERNLKDSRSGTAIQIKKHKIRNGSIGGIKYMSKLLANFKKSLFR